MSGGSAFTFEVDLVPSKSNPAPSKDVDDVIAAAAPPHRGLRPTLRHQHPQSGARPRPGRGLVSKPAISFVSFSPPDALGPLAHVLEPHRWAQESEVAGGVQPSPAAFELEFGGMSDDPTAQGLSKKDQKKAKKEAKKEAKRRKKASKDVETVEMSNPLSAMEDWPTDSSGRQVLDVRKGLEMRDAITALYAHLRNAKTPGSTKDTYGLWMQMNDSEEEEEDDDAEHAGEVYFDRDAASKRAAAKKTKKAFRVGNPQLMASEEVLAELKKLGKSTKGDKKTLVRRLTAAYDEQAEKMRSNTRVVNHFNSEITKRNLQLMIAKVNQGRMTGVQNKLKGAHDDIRTMASEMAQCVCTPVQPLHPQSFPLSNG